MAGGTGMADLPAFERMVRAGSPEIARPACTALAWADALSDGRLLLRLRVQGGRGAVDAVDEMVQEDGRWRVNGLLTTPAADTTA